MNRLYSLLAAVDIGEPNVPNVTPSDGTVTAVLSVISGIGAGVALLIISIGALKLVTSRGNPEALNKARDTIIYAIVGFVICVAAFIIVTFVVEQV